MDKIHVGWSDHNGEMDENEHNSSEKKERNTFVDSIIMLPAPVDPNYE